MVVFPNCKINLGLKVLRKRADGYHDLSTVFYPLPFYDSLEIVQSPVFSFTQTGHQLSIPDGENICVKAWQLLKKDFPSLPEVAMHLHKTIPAGAGLGGGSADGAFVLKLANRKFRLGIPEAELTGYALQLGSDCPFFIINRPAIGNGRGEILEPVALDLSQYQLLIVNPGIHVHTGQAFSFVRPSATGPDPASIMDIPVTEWKNVLLNDFEPGVFSLHPEIGKIRDRLYEAGAIYAAMSGTGSTVFGLFEKTTPTPSFPVHYLVRSFYD
ncbi:MAG: 4-(cytidine 5'-diphospho)-2-C-methyl-D-erythritol kinase [Chitinophagaceae bacterium]|nr:MAG: 4-(cytidine 5'-diphospho)-2-C-methyl-D-erythritol kinase [Chitinophagaceae bacterium]